MLDLAKLAVSSFDELIEKRRELSNELAILDTLLEHLHQAEGRRSGTAGRGFMSTRGRLFLRMSAGRADRVRRSRSCARRGARSAPVR